MDREDVRQECLLAFLETAMAYDHISGAYKFTLKNRVIKLLKQILPEAPVPEGMTVEDLVGAYAPVHAPELEIDESWVEGETADIFDCLEPEERRLVKLHWHDNLPGETCARILAISPSTFERRKEAIRKKLSHHLRTVPQRPSPLRKDLAKDDETA
jgi:DNA-directed RNA polymerase specialized sigma24 family protein